MTSAKAKVTDGIGKVKGSHGSSDSDNSRLLRDQNAGMADRVTAMRETTSNSNRLFGGEAAGDRPSEAGSHRFSHDASWSVVRGPKDLGLGEPRTDTSVEKLDDSTLTWFKKRNGDTLQGALAFVPWILQQAYLDNDSALDHRGSGAVVVSDASGFTDLTDKLSQRDNGAELLSQCLKAFFTPLIDLINAYRGDVIKFTRNALTIYFQAVDDTTSPKYNCVVPPHGTYGLPDLGPMATAVLRASACCIEIHKRLHMFDTTVDGVALCQHIGVGCGEVRILQVGGETPPETHVRRCEYIIAGPPLEQIATARPLAKSGETCLSPHAWEYIKDCVIEGKPIQERPEYHLLSRMDESKYTFPTIKHAAMENDNRMDSRFKLSELPVIRRYIPSAVFKQIECGTLIYVNEMRNISTVFVRGTNLDVMSNRGANQAQDLMLSMQRCCYQHEGTLNKFVIDSKGMLFLFVFGLPPLVHQDDPTRAVLACFDMVKVFKRLDVPSRFGVTTGRSYCGVVGSSQRMEYTVLGDCVNIAAKLMSTAAERGILTDEETKNRCTTEVIFNALAPIKLKGKGLVQVFQPVRKEASSHVGITNERRLRFPWYEHPFANGQVAVSATSSAMQQNVVQLCSVKSWAGITAVQEMLGGSFNKHYHQAQQVIDPKAVPTVQAPAGSPFVEGGVVVLESQSGMGKVELAEHIVVHCAVGLRIMPVFGAMGPRPGDSIRLAVELLRSTLGVYRLFATEHIPDDDFQALQKLAPQELQSELLSLKPALKDTGSKERTSHVLEAALDVVIALLKNLVKTTPLLMTLQFEYGTSLFPKKLKDEGIFWNAVTQLTTLVQNEMQNGKAAGHKPLVMMIVCREANSENAAVKIAKERKTFVQLYGLGEESMLEYMSNYMRVAEQVVPPPLRQFVRDVTSGNPLFIRETIDQLQENHIQVKLGADNQPKQIEIKDMDKVHISSWQHTAMVGGTVCLLESLDPLEAAVLKMSTCFNGTFTLPDLAASTCSRWADATHFDFLRLYKAIQKLVKSNIIESIEGEDADRNVPNGSGNNKFLGMVGKFQTRNRLIRAVGGAMVLEAQKKTVKRQALIDRALWRKLPARMAILDSRRKEQHIPWYYEQAFRRM